jgi:hypothetical protein
LNLVDGNRPLRVLDKVLQGGLGLGNVGVVMAQHGLGKVAVLTSIAIDHAMDGKNALHVSVGKSVSDTRAFHDEVLHEILGSMSLDPGLSSPTTIVERHKQIYSFPDPGGFTLEKLDHTVAFLREHADFAPAMIELSGWPDFDQVGPETMAGLKQLAVRWNCEIWVSAHTHQDAACDERGIPLTILRCIDDIEVLLALEPEADHVNLKFLKTHGEPRSSGIHLEFDPNSMLIRWR